MSIHLPRAIWADNGETPVMLVELGWNRFRLFARANDGTWKMSATMTAHEASNPGIKHFDARQPVGSALNRWLGATYAELTGEECAA